MSKNEIFRAQNSTQHVHGQFVHKCSRLDCIYTPKVKLYIYAKDQTTLRHAKDQTANMYPRSDSTYEGSSISS